MEDPTIRRLTKKVFPYIWLQHKLIPSVSSHSFFSFSELTIFSHEIGKAAIVYLHMYRPVLSNYLEKHISLMPHSKMQFWTHVAFLCLQVRLTNDHVFDYFLTVCSVTAEVALHCYINGYEDVLPFASVFLCAFFETELYESFHGAEGWMGLHRYIHDTCCTELYELVDCYVRKIESSSEHLPVLISIKREELAAQRRKNLLSLRLEKVGAIELKEKAKSLVSGIFNWDFLENQRISEIRPGILKRMENIRHKKKKPTVSLNEEGNEELLESGSVMVTKNEISDADNLLCELQEAGPSESVASVLEERSDHKSGQILNELKYTEVKKEFDELCRTSEIYEKGNIRPSSSLYESASSLTEKETKNSKFFRNNNSTLDALKHSAIKGVPNEKGRNCERYPQFVPYSNANGRTIPKNENFTPDTLSELTNSFQLDPLFEVSKSFQEMGFSCLCVGNSSHHDEKFNALTNYAEIMDKCNYFKNKYSSIQFAFLIPNEYFKKTISQASTTESYDTTSFKEESNEQQIPTNKMKDFEYGSDTPQRHQSRTQKPRFQVTKVNENQFSLQNEPALQTHRQKCNDTIKKIAKTDLLSRGDSFEISRFSVTIINENPMISENEASSLENVSTITPPTALRGMKVEKNQSKDQLSALYKNYASETTKISRFTITKIKEDCAKEKTDKKICSNEKYTTSRFTVTKIKEDNAKEETDPKICSNEKSKISRFTVTKIQENNAKEETDQKIFSNEKTKTSRFTVTKIKENNAREETAKFEKNWRNESTKTSRFTVTKIDENKLKDPVSILRKNSTNDTPKISRFNVKKVFDDPLISRASRSILRKSSPTNVSRFSVTKVDESETRLWGKNNSDREIFDDTENETVELQENGSVKYQKRVRFSEIPFVSFFHPYSSDESPNSKTSMESLNENSPEESLFSRDSTKSGHNEDLSSTPTLRNVAPPERQELFGNNTFDTSQTSNNNTQSSNASISLGKLGRIFRSNSGSSKTRPEKKK